MEGKALETEQPVNAGGMASDVSNKVRRDSLPACQIDTDFLRKQWITNYLSHRLSESTKMQ